MAQAMVSLPCVSAGKARCQYDIAPECLRRLCIMERGEAAMPEGGSGTEDAVTVAYQRSIPAQLLLGMQRTFESDRFVCASKTRSDGYGRRASSWQSTERRRRKAGLGALPGGLHVSDQTARRGGERGRRQLSV